MDSGKESSQGMGKHVIRANNTKSVSRKRLKINSMTPHSLTSFQTVQHRKGEVGVERNCT